MDLNYKSVVTFNGSETIYKENTNVFAYYVIKSLLFINFNEMIYWCLKNNKNILQFDNNLDKVQAFCVLIKEKYDSQLAISMISNLKNNYKNNLLQMDLYDFIF